MGTKMLVPFLSIWKIWSGLLLFSETRGSDVHLYSLASRKNEIPDQSPPGGLQKHSKIPISVCEDSIWWMAQSVSCSKNFTIGFLM